MAEAWLSVIVPTLNEAPHIQDLLQHLQPLRARGGELIVVDGGSEDGTAALAEPCADDCLHSARGRAVQQHTGAGRARGRWLWFVHADSGLDDAVLDAILALEQRPAGWGFFAVRLQGPHGLLPWIARGMNLRSRLTRVATGDQCLFVHREFYEHVGGFPQLALMEDIALSKRLRRLSAPRVIAARVDVSSRRWQRKGVLRTVLLMWGLRLAYVAGVSPERLQRWYYRTGR